MLTAKRQQLAEWWAHTHGPGFELTRHFVRRLFDNELVSSSDHMVPLVAGIAAAVASVAWLMPLGLVRKYTDLYFQQSVPLFRGEFLGDSLFFVSLVMVATGFLTVLQWPSLFPSIRDTLVLLPLPVTLRSLFVAKLSALLALMGLLLGALCLPLGAVAAFAMAVPWQPGTLAAAVVFTLVLIAAGAATFFFLLAMQGLMLLVLPTRWFTPVSLAAQSVLLVALLCFLPLLGHVAQQGPLMLREEASLLELPPVWFVGLAETALGRGSPYLTEAARRAGWLTVTSTGAALLLYFLAYRRHAGRIWEQPAAFRGLFGLGAVASALGPRLVGRAGELAILSFTLKTLVRSPRHKVIAAGYAGVAAALVLDGLLALGAQEWSRRSAFEINFLQAVLSAPLVLLFFVLYGLRHVFALPMEPRANWVFKFTEGEHRAEWLDAVERAFVVFSVLPVVVLSVPLIGILTAPGLAIAHGTYVAALGLLLVEMLLADWRKLPFTCYYLPAAKRPPAQTAALLWLAFALFVTAATGFEVWLLRRGVSPFVLAGLAGIAWWRLRVARREHWGEMPLIFEDVPEPAVTVLSLRGE